MYIETWMKLRCPQCQSINWINQGDVTDQTAPDRTSCECWNCEKVFLVYDDFEDEDDGLTEKGRKKPS